MSYSVRVELPPHLCLLAGAPRELQLTVAGPATQRTLLDALEQSYPALLGTLRDHTTQQRRPFIRFFAEQQDLSHMAPDEPLPEPVAAGREPLLILGAIAGG